MLKKLFVAMILPATVHATVISGSPFDTTDAPLPLYLNTHHEKAIYVDPVNHFYGAYDTNGKLRRWGIATTGADYCQGEKDSCRTHVGHFRIYSLGSENCTSSKFPFPTGGAPMPYCMFFAGGQAIHGSDNVEESNASHGCVRVHVDDAKWLRYQFVEAPNKASAYHGTQVIIAPYTQ